MDIYLSVCMKKLSMPSQGGVRMVLCPDALTSLNSTKKIHPRIIVATFNGNLSTKIICYSPINASVETDLTTFYNQLSPFVRSIPKHNVLIIGKDENKKFCLHNLSNRNGEHLTDISLENEHALILISRKVRENYGSTDLHLHK